MGTSGVKLLHCQVGRMEPREVERLVKVTRLPGGSLETRICDYISLCQVLTLITP